MDFSRFKAYDYGVIGLFILTIIGVSLSWYTVSLPSEVFGESAELGAQRGWDTSLGVLAFVMALIALLWVGLKAVLGSRGPFPYWYLEGLVLIVVGALITLFAIIRIIDKPGGGELLGLKVGYGVGIFLTLIAGVLIAGCGYLAMNDRSLTAGGAARTPLGEPPVGGPAGRGVRYCENCGTPLDPGARFCRTCGRPQ